MSGVRGQSSWYARSLRLRHVRPGGLMSFLLFECVIALAVLLALAELVSWWAVAVLPAAVAAMVKINDLVAGAAGRESDAAAEVDAEPLSVPAVPQVRSSRIYVSESRAATESRVATGSRAATESRAAAESRATAVEPEQPPMEVERRTRSTRANRTSVSRTRTTRERRATHAEAGVVEHPEWRQTITLEALGRHARDDQRRSVDMEPEAGDARHRAGAANQGRFA
jgi:hypothetical protein